MSNGIFSNKPYLIRAFYQWIVDCDLTPYIVIDVSVAGDSIFDLLNYTKKNRLVLDISPKAVLDLQLNNRNVLFAATFNGEVLSLDIPMRAIISIYAKENKQGCDFGVEDSEQDLPPDNNKLIVGKPPELRLV